MSRLLGSYGYSITNEQLAVLNKRNGGVVSKFDQLVEASRASDILGESGIFTEDEKQEIILVDDMIVKALIRWLQNHPLPV